MLAVRRAHDAAVAAALGYLQREAGEVRRGKDGVTRLPGGGFVAAAFRHRTSRAGDPQLQTHVLVAKVTRGADGRFSALDGQQLYAQAKPPARSTRPRCGMSCVTSGSPGRSGTVRG